MSTQTITRHAEDIKGLVLGLALVGDDGCIEILYDGEKCGDRRAAIATDMSNLLAAGYRVAKLGRVRGVKVQFTNVGNVFNARYVK